MINGKTIGFLGGGNMSTAIIAGLVNQINSSAIHVFDRNADKNAQLHKQYGVCASANAQELIDSSDVLICAVKPQGLHQLIADHAQRINAQKPLLISVAAGITTDSITKWLGAEQAIVRAMPNTPALINQGATGLYANASTSEDQRQLAEKIMSAVGICVWVGSDQDIDAVTALSGSGPAYFLTMLNAMIEAAIKHGIEPEAARILAFQTAKGSAVLAKESDDDIATLVRNITSPKGTTEAALNVLSDAHFDDIVDSAFDAALKRAAQLARELG